MMSTRKKSSLELDVDADKATMANTPDTLNNESDVPSVTVSKTHPHLLFFCLHTESFISLFVLGSPLTLLEHN